VAGEKQCQFCKAKAMCPELKAQATKNIRADFNIKDVIITHDLLNQAKLAELWSSSVLSHAKDQIIAGTPISGWRLKEGRRMKTWKNETFAAEALKDYPKAFMLRTPAGALKAGVEIPDGLIDETRTAPSLAREEGVATMFDDISMNVNDIPVKPDAQIKAANKASKKDIKSAIEQLEALK